MSIELVCNQALDAIGHKRHIDSIWDGTPEARVALNAYADTRDAVLAAQPWMFARAFYRLERVSSVQSLLSYRRPASAIVVLDVYSSVFDPYDPEPSRWVESYSGGERLILTSAETATAAVTDRVLDPADWPPDFTSVVIQALAQRLTRLLPAPPKEERQ